MKLKDCREIFNILNQKVKVEQILNTWGYEFDGYYIDGFESKEEAEIAVLKRIIKEAKAQVN